MFNESTSASFSINDSNELSQSSRNKRNLIKNSFKLVRQFSHQSITDLEQNRKHSIHKPQLDYNEDSVGKDKNNSAIIAGFNVVNLILGIGILGVPYAVAKGSYFALVIVVLTAFIACSTGIMLISCLYEERELDGYEDIDEDSYDSKNPIGINTTIERKIRVRDSYSEIGAAVWPKFGGKFVTIVAIIEMFGGNTLYLVLLSGIGHQLAVQFISPNISIYWCALILGFLPVPLFLVKRLSIVSWFSFIAVVGLLGCIASLMIFCVIRAVDLPSYGNQESIWKVFQEFNIAKVPLSVGIITFSYCAHAAFVGVEGSMHTPSQFPTMMRTSFSIAAIVKFVMPLLFVLIFGKNTAQQCTEDIDNVIFQKIIGIFVFINTFFSLPLTIFVVCERMDDVMLPLLKPNFIQNPALNMYWMVLSRTTVQALSLFLAILIPHFALLMGFIGSITGSLLTFILPCLFSLKLQYAHLNRLQVIYRITIIILGILFGISGFIVSLIDIIHTF